MGINDLVKLKVDELIKIGVNNFKIIKHLEAEINVPDDLLPTNKQITSRRHYLMGRILKELKNNKLGGFITWLSENTIPVSDASDHDFLVLDHTLQEDDFIIIFSTKSLLANAVKQAQVTGKSFLALDSTHKLVSCGFMFTTFATATLMQNIADIGYMLHYHEDSKSHVVGLKAIKQALLDICGFNWEPKVYIFT